MWSIIMISIREVLVYKRTFFGDQLLSSFSPSSFSVTRALLPTFKLHSATYCTGAHSVHKDILINIIYSIIHKLCQWPIIMTYIGLHILYLLIQPHFIYFNILYDRVPIDLQKIKDCE